MHAMLPNRNTPDRSRQRAASIDGGRHAGNNRTSVVPNPSAHLLPEATMSTTNDRVGCHTWKVAALKNALKRKIPLVEKCSFIQHGLCHMCSNSNITLVMNVCPMFDFGHSICMTHFESITSVSLSQVIQGKMFLCPVCTLSCSCDVCDRLVLKQIETFDQWSTAGKSSLENNPPDTTLSRPLALAPISTVRTMNAPDTELYAVADSKEDPSSAPRIAAKSRKSVVSSKMASSTADHPSQTTTDPMLRAESKEAFTLVLPPAASFAGMVHARQPKEAKSIRENDIMGASALAESSEKVVEKKPKEASKYIPSTEARAHSNHNIIPAEPKDVASMPRVAAKTTILSAEPSVAPKAAAKALPQETHLSMSYVERHAKETPSNARHLEAFYSTALDRSSRFQSVGEPTVQNEPNHVVDAMNSGGKSTFRKDRMNQDESSKEVETRTSTNEDRESNVEDNDHDENPSENPVAQRTQDSTENISPNEDLDQEKSHNSSSRKREKTTPNEDEDPMDVSNRKTKQKPEKVKSHRGPGRPPKRPKETTDGAAPISKSAPEDEGKKKRGKRRSESSSPPSSPKEAKLSSFRERKQRAAAPRPGELTNQHKPGEGKYHDSKHSERSTGMKTTRSVDSNDVAKRSKAEKRHGSPDESAPKKRAREDTEEDDEEEEDEDDEEVDTNLDFCSLCKDDGDLVCCDICPRSFHLACLEMTEDDLPDGDWQCPECTSKQSEIHFEKLGHDLATHRHKNQSLMRQLLLGIIAHPFSKPFMTPVEDVDGYDDVVKERMDLKTVKKRLEAGEYHEKPLDNAFVKDIRLIWYNCRLFNDEKSGLSRAAKTLSTGFEAILTQLKN
ncbi:hypothetical protein AeMF1_012253 [Aphanomyces euteiches]|nr:hypothetical protein AeMF1_012253 [Aphanomyces euteiches]